MVNLFSLFSVLVSFVVSSTVFADQIKFFTRANKIELADGNVIDMVVKPGEHIFFTDLAPGTPWPHSVTYTSENIKTQEVSQSISADQPPKRFADAYRYPVTCFRQPGSGLGSFEAYEISDLIDQTNKLKLIGPPGQIHLNNVSQFTKSYFVDLNPLANWAHNAMVVVRGRLSPVDETVIEKVLVRWKPQIPANARLFLTGNIFSCDYNVDWAYENLEVPK